MGKHGYTSWMQNGDPNPTSGELDTPLNGTPDYGGGAPAASKPVTVPTTGNDYSGWNWEEILVGVLGLQLPSRNDVVNQPWTAINWNSSGGSGLLRIFAATWSNSSVINDHQDIFVYLNPNLLQPGGIWDNYFFQPYQAISDAVQGNYTGVQIDPMTFADAAAEVQGVISFYQGAENTFQDMSNNLQGDANQFKGQAGGAFAQLINNLYEAANSAYGQMTSPANYATLISDAGSQAITFYQSLWATMANWIAMLDHQPLGAIYQALEDGGVITVDGSGNYNMVNSGSTDSSFGDLTEEGTWIAIEASAKQLWLASVQSALDPHGQTALNALVTSFMAAASGDQALNPPTLEPISPGNPNDPNNIGGDNIPNIDIGGGDPNLNLGGGGNGGGNPNLDIGGGGNGGGNPNLDIGGGGNGGGGNPNLDLGGGNGLNLPGGANGPGSVDTSLGGSGGGSLGIPGGLNGPGSVGTSLGGSGGPSGPGSVDTSLGGPGGIGLSTPELNSLKTALADNGQTQAALQQALALAPPTGPLHNELTTALANNAKARNALQAALAGTEPAASALQTALSSNGQAQAALRKALTLAPSKGPLHNALETALGDTRKTQSALNKVLSSGNIPESSSIHQALNSDKAVSSLLHKALVSSQVPGKGPLHSTLTHALAESGKVKSELDEGLGGGMPNMAALHHALSSNAALQSQLRNALSQAPAHGALHNELMTALADSKRTAGQIHQALAQGGVTSELPPGTSVSLGNPAGALTGPYSSLGKGGLTASLGGVGGGGGAGSLSTALGGGGVGGAGIGGGVGGAGIGGGLGLGHGGLGGGGSVGSTAGLGSGGSGTGSFGSGGSASPGTASSSGSGSSAVPFFPPMAGSGMGGIGGQQQQERERSTWLSEDEGAWGTDPQVGPAVLGRDFFADEDVADDYDDYDEAAAQVPARESSRIRAR